MDFEVHEHAALAVAQRHGTTITTAAGVFQLSVRHASKAEWDAAVAAQQGNDGILRVKGLPTQAGPLDVLAFFQERVGGQLATGVEQCAHLRVPPQGANVLAAGGRLCVQPALCGIA